MWARSARDAGASKTSALARTAGASILDNSSIGMAWPRRSRVHLLARECTHVYYIRRRMGGATSVAQPRMASRDTANHAHAKAVRRPRTTVANQGRPPAETICHMPTAIPADSAVAGLAQLAIKSLSGVHCARGKRGLRRNRDMCRTHGARVSGPRGPLQTCRAPVGLARPKRPSHSFRFRSDVREKTDGTCRINGIFRVHERRLRAGASGAALRQSAADVARRAPTKLAH